MITLRLLITKHAKDMMTERGIDEEQVKRVITRGAHSRQTDGCLACYTYIEVAYRNIGCETYKIKTVKIRK